LGKPNEPPARASPIEFVIPASAGLRRGQSQPVHIPHCAFEGSSFFLSSISLFFIKPPGGGTDAARPRLFNQGVKKTSEKGTP
jgi:hypothetical protein